MDGLLTKSADINSQRKGLPGRPKSSHQRDGLQRLRPPDAVVVEPPKPARLAMHRSRIAFSMHLSMRNCHEPQKQKERSEASAV